MMLSLLEALAGYVSVPTWQIVVALLFFLVMQIVGEIMELFGKAAPGIMKLRKARQEKRDKERKRDEMLFAATKALEEFNSHYSPDNIKVRNEWMHDVDGDREEYHSYRDESRADRASLHGEIAVLSEKIDRNNEITLALQIENKRSAIIGFAARVADPKALVTHEEFRRIFKVYEEYEKIIQENNMTNGEVDISIRIIGEAYEDRLKTHAFVEDVRGYNG